MSVSMHRKVAFGVLGLALTALVVDRAVLGPSGASAAPAPQTPATAAEPAQRRVVLGSPAAKASAARLENRLKVATGAPKWSADEVVDSLRKSPTWATGEPASTAGAAQSAAGFRDKHELRAILSPNKGSGVRIAMVGGKAVKPGDSLDGYTLVSVGARSAVFESGTVRVVLTLPGLPEPEAR